MITKGKVRIYGKYGGDIDAWVRMGSKRQLAIMDDDDWGLIDSFIQGITLVRSGLASDDFASALKRRIEENCDSEKTIILLEKLASKM